MIKTPFPQDADERFESSDESDGEDEESKSEESEDDEDEDEDELELLREYAKIKKEREEE